MRRTLVLLLTASAAFAQDAALARLKQAVTRAHSQQETQQGDQSASIAAVHEALRSWIESRLPRDIYSLASESWHAQEFIRTELTEAGLLESDSAREDLNWQDPGFSFVRVEVKLLTEVPDTLVVTAGVSVPCGEDAAVYLYRFDSNGRSLIASDHPGAKWGWGSAETELSAPDSQGRRLLLVHWTSVQCGSTWMGMKYTVRRLGPAKPPELLLSGEHGFWFEEDAFFLAPDELLVEVVDTGIDTERRTFTLRYSFADGSKRVEPFALQPQDFAQEWLTRPWSEIEPLSAPATEKWHAVLHAAFILADYTNVIACASKPDRWMIGFNIRTVGEKKLGEPIDRYFLVHDLGHYHYQMEAVSEKPFEGCPGHGDPSTKHPWLSLDELKNLP